MNDKYKDVGICRGCWSLGTACGDCQKCIDTKPTELSDKQREIGGIENTYGGLRVKEEKGAYFWSIEDYCASPWKEIPQSLYCELMKHQDGIEKSHEA